MFKQKKEKTVKLFLHKNSYKLLAIFLVGFFLIGLTSCRPDVNYWYNNVYTDWGHEFQFQSFWDGFWGWSVSILSYPFAWLCSSIGKGLGNSYFWGIVFTTIIIRTIAWPIYSKQNSMSIKMQVMQPELDKLQKKYQFRQDEKSQARMKQEMMMIYKKYKVNPMGCIFTSFIQFPIFIAMYEVVKRINLTTTTITSNGVLIENYGKFALHNTKLFGYFELNNTSFTNGEMKDRIFCLAIAILYTIVTVLNQKIAQKKPSYVKKTNYNEAANQGGQMKMMNIIMVFLMFFVAISSTALGIYWLIGGLYQTVQSVVGRKLNERSYYKMTEGK